MFTYSVCPIFFTLPFFSIACFVCHLRLLFSAAACMHAALLPLKCCSPLSETYRSSRGHPVTAVTQRIGGGESLRKRGRDWRTELRGKPGSHEHRSVYKLKLCGQERRRSLPGEYYWLASLEHIFNPSCLRFGSDIC